MIGGRSLAGVAATVALVCGACSFDTAGVVFSDAGTTLADAPLPPDARTNDAPPGTPDARIPDASVPIDAALPDQDNDGEPDLTDNCIDTFNPDQADEDSDGVGDACDNCPHISNPLQEDAGELLNGQEPDGIGDICDPRPDDGGDVMVVFDGFNGNTLNAMWVPGPGSGSNSWQLDNGFLSQPMSNLASRSIMRSGLNISRGVVDTAFIVDTIAPGAGAEDGSRNIGPVGAFGTGGGVFGEGYGCLQWVNPNDLTGGTELLFVSFDGATATTLDTAPVAWNMTPGGVYFIRNAWDGPANLQGCGIITTGQTEVTIAGTDTFYTSGSGGVRMYGIAARFAYIVIYSLGD